MSLFNKLFSLRFNISSETEILEMCGWDEARAAEVTEILSDSIQTAVDSVSLISSPSKDLIIDKVSSLLSNDLDDHEVETLTNIFRNVIENFNFLDDSESSQYEN